jgi:hypothetical protein
MHDAISLTGKILEMITEFNTLSIEREALDPLSDANFKIQIIYPSGNGIAVLIDIDYSSGGGEESSYTINDKISFIITRKQIINIIFQQEFNSRVIADIPLTEQNAGDFANRIRKACESVLPPPIGL